MIRRSLRDSHVVAEHGLELFHEIIVHFFLQLVFWTRTWRLSHLLMLIIIKSLVLMIIVLLVESCEVGDILRHCII